MAVRAFPNKVHSHTVLMREIESYLYQSNGNCKNQCSGYAFAVLQGSTCWCSNTMPGSTQSINDCDQACPGYPNDHCGSISNDLFGYIALDVTPSSTADGSASSKVSASRQSRFHFLIFLFAFCFPLYHLLWHWVWWPDISRVTKARWLVRPLFTRDGAWHICRVWFSRWRVFAASMMWFRDWHILISV